jgi:hypothetical protein
MHMMKIGKTVVAVLALCCLVAGVCGCKKEGPAERAGKAIDNSAEKAGQEVEQAGNKIKGAIDDLKK